MISLCKQETKTLTPRGRTYLFKWCGFSHVIQHYTSIRSTTCKQFSLEKDIKFMSCCWADLNTSMFEHRKTVVVREFFTLWHDKGRLSMMGSTVSYLHGVEADGAEAVYAPGERANWTAPLLIPDVHLLATRCKYRLLLVMVQPCVHGLWKKNHFYLNQNVIIIQIFFIDFESAQYLITKRGEFMFIMW